MVFYFLKLFKKKNGSRKVIRIEPAIANLRLASPHRPEKLNDLV
jgi:hypothetical protein